MTLDNKTQIAAQFKPEIDNINSEIESLKQEINKKEAARNTLYKTYIAQAEGTKGTKKIGKGPVYKEKNIMLL
jgi:phage host-nuclease inhibitor protein Gam